MIKIIVTTAALMLSFGVQAQDAISRFFEKYTRDDSFTNISVTSRMFSLFTNLEMESEEDQEILDAIGKLEGLKILTKDQPDGKGMEMYFEAIDRLAKNDFEELMSIRDEEKDIKFMIKERGKIISELVMVMGSREEFFVLTLFGEIDLKQVAKISKAMDIDGLDNLKNLNKED